MNKQYLGVISDTHGLLRKTAVDILKDCSLIIHAGDIGNPKILEDLELIAPVVAVKGNCDKGEWTDKIPKVQTIRFGEVYFYIVHDIKDFNIDSKNAKINVIVFGHSHKPAIDEKNGILFLNPGSIGPRRFNLPVSMAILSIYNKSIDVNFKEIY